MYECNISKCSHNRNGKCLGECEEPCTDYPVAEFMNFKEWIEEHPEYGVKVIEHPTKEQLEQQKKLIEMGRMTWDGTKEVNMNIKYFGSVITPHQYIGTAILLR